MRRRFTMNKGFTEPINIDNYLTIEAHEDGLTASLSVNACEYCVDGNGNWKTLSAGTATESINSGHTLSFRGNLTPNDTNGIGTFTINKKCNLKGNCMSMIFGDNAYDNYSLSGKNYAFYELFYNCSNIVNVSSNFLPATTLANYCYYSMFYNCTSLTTAPELPAKTLASSCYRRMFYDCYNLTTAPELPATTLVFFCYSNMFSGCKSLTTAPELPATTLAMYCYYYMFNGCKSLTTAPELPATSLTDYCYTEMFSGCTNLNYIKCLATVFATNCTGNWVSGVASTGTFVKAPSTSWRTGNSGIPNGWTVEEYIDYTKEPLTFNILSAGTINWTASDTTVTKTIDYKLNDGEWVSITSNTDSSAPTIEVNPGDKIQFRGDNTAYCGDNPDLYSTFGGSTAEFEIEGNIMSLINSTDFSTLTTLESNFTFAFLFSNCTGLTSAENLILPATPLTMGCYFMMFQSCTSLTIAPKLPATTLAMGCYVGMFMDCTSLITAPELPAITLANACYSDMFRDCTSLTTVPSNLLPATTLADSCYGNMFLSCTSLTTAPELPATTLSGSCYYQMFYGCTSLNYIKCLATDISAAGCTLGWVDGVASTGTFVQNPDMDEWETGINGIPVNWTVEGRADLSTKPLTFSILSAGTINWTASDASITKTIEYKLNNGEWTSIISNIGSSAPTITVNSGDKIQFRGNNEQYGIDYDNYNSFSGSTALFEAKGNIMSLIYGDDFKNKLTISSTDAFAGLFRNCTNLVSAKNLILPATTLADYCYFMMFDGCSSLTTAPTLPSTILANHCYSNMFQGCTKLTTAPELPATTLAKGCYNSMFAVCTSLTTAPELLATRLTDFCYNGMFYKCTKLNYIKCLATNISAFNCTINWVNGVASTGTFVKESSMTSWPTGTKGIPTGWTVQNA